MAKAVTGPAGRPYAIQASLIALAGFAWVGLFLGERSPYGRYLQHESAAEAALPGLLFFLTGWGLMLVATLVPSAMPLLESFREVVRRRARPALLQAQLVAGFLGVWLFVGYLAYGADSLLHAAVDQLPWLEGRPQLIAAGVLALAGLFQFSALKDRCLVICRSPRSLLFLHWGGSGTAGSQARRIGVAYGLSCVGCCWALMLLMFAFAMGSLAWMAGLALLMAVERGVPWGQRLTRPLGVGLFAAAVAVAALG